MDGQILGPNARIIGISVAEVRGIRLEESLKVEKLKDCRQAGVSSDSRLNPNKNPPLGDL